MLSKALTLILNDYCERYNSKILCMHEGLSANFYHQCLLSLFLFSSLAPKYWKDNDLFIRQQNKSNSYQKLINCYESRNLLLLGKKYLIILFEDSWNFFSDNFTANFVAS